MKIDANPSPIKNSGTSSLTSISNEPEVASTIERFGRLYERTQKPFYVFFVSSDTATIDDSIVQRIVKRVDPQNDGQVLNLPLDSKIGPQGIRQLEQLKDGLSRTTQDPVVVIASGFENIMKGLMNAQHLGAHEFCQVLKESDSLDARDLRDHLNGKKCIVIVHCGNTQGAKVLQGCLTSIGGCDFHDGFVQLKS